MLKKTHWFLSQRPVRLFVALVLFFCTIENMYLMMLRSLSSYEQNIAIGLAAVLTIAGYAAIFYGFEFFREESNQKKKEEEIN